MPRLWRKTGTFLSETRDVSRCFLRQSRGAFGVGETGYLARFSSSVGNGSKSHGLPFFFCCSDTPLNAAALSPFPMRRCPLSCRSPNSSPALACFWASPLPFPLRGRGLWGRGLFFIFWGFISLLSVLTVLFVCGSRHKACAFVHTAVFCLMGADFSRRRDDCAGSVRAPADADRHCRDGCRFRWCRCPHARA